MTTSTSALLFGEVRPYEVSVSDPVHAFSIDVEDYFQVSAFEGAVPRDSWSSFEPRVEQNLSRLADLCEQHDVRATLFVLGWTVERCRNLIRELSDQGHEVAIHGYDHSRITSQSPAAFRQDVRKTKQILEDLIGNEVIGYRAPSFSIVENTLWALEVLRDEGIRYDSSVFPIRHDRYGIPEAPRFPFVIGFDHQNDAEILVEFPMSTIRVAGMNLPFSGGGYLRLLPFWYVRWAMWRHARHYRQPVIFYVHPWEVDPGQPRFEVSLPTRIRHYRNLGKTEERLRALFRRYRFTTIRKVLNL